MYLDVKGVCKMECFWWFIHRYRYSKVYLKMLSGYPRRKESTKKRTGEFFLFPLSVGLYFVFSKLVPDVLSAVPRHHAEP